MPGIAAGDVVVDTLPMLADQPGTSPDLVLRWNDMMSAPAELDLVLHLHGYSQAGAGMNLTVDKMPISGVDFGDPDLPPGSTAARSSPTLGIIPRGRYFGGRTGCGYDFPVMSEPSSCHEVVRDAMGRFAAATGGNPSRHAARRRILTAHSGGGAAVMPVALGFDPHEIHIFDALYNAADELLHWAARAIRGDAAALRASPEMSVAAYMERWGRALRVAYVENTGTAPASAELARRIEAALDREGSLGRRLAPWYRVEAVTLDHALMPRYLGWRWLTDAGSDVPSVVVQPPAGSKG